MIGTFRKCSDEKLPLRKRIVSETVQLSEEANAGTAMI